MHEDDNKDDGGVERTSCQSYQYNKPCQITRKSTNYGLFARLLAHLNGLHRCGSVSLSTDRIFMNLPSYTMCWYWFRFLYWTTTGELKRIDGGRETDKSVRREENLRGEVKTKSSFADL